MDGIIPEYRILRSRRKTISLEITPQGELLVRCPVRTSKAAIRQVVESRRSWITAHLAKIAGRQKTTPLTQEDLNALAEQAKKYIPGRVSHFAEASGISYGRITIRAQRTRWGSCSASGNLNFNCLLMLAPPDVLDYVVVHELCHRREMNHSCRFWAEVEQILPDYRMQKQWLKENGAVLLAKLPRP